MMQSAPKVIDQQEHLRTDHASEAVIRDRGRIGQICNYRGLGVTRISVQNVQSDDVRSKHAHVGVVTDLERVSADVAQDVLVLPGVTAEKVLNGRDS
jgi:hypothetical protein